MNALTTNMPQIPSSNQSTLNKMPMRGVTEPGMPGFTPREIDYSVEESMGGFKERPGATTPDYNNMARSIANNAGMLYSLSQKPESVEEIKNRRAGKFDEILSKYRGLISKREPYDDRIGRREAVKSARAFEKQALKTPSRQAARMGRKFVGKGFADAMTAADMAESQYKRGQDIQEAQMLMPLAQAELQAGENQAAREYRAEAEKLGAKSKYTDVVSGRLADNSMLADVRAKEKNIADMNAAQADFLYRTYGIRV
jgi:hypothetical protein